MDNKYFELTDVVKDNFLNAAKEVLRTAAELSAELSHEVVRGINPAMTWKSFACCYNDDLIVAKRNSFLIQARAFTCLGDELTTSKKHYDFIEEFNEFRLRVRKEIKEVEEAYKNFQLRKRGGSKDLTSQKEKQTNPSELTEDISDKKLSTSDKAVIGTTVGTAAAAAATSVPYLVGFTNAGVAAGSLAASIQAGIGSVAAGSSFAVLQSVGATTLMGSPIGLAIGAGVAVTGGVTIGAIKIAEHVKRKKKAEK